MDGVGETVRASAFDPKRAFNLGRAPPDKLCSRTSQYRHAPKVVARIYTDKLSENFSQQFPHQLVRHADCINIKTTIVLSGKSAMKNLMFAAAALMLGVAVSGTASAGVITFGHNNLGNGFPFSSPKYTPEYQQVYDGSFFPGPVDITQITFFPALAQLPAITGNFTLDLSTTSAGPTTLSTVYANNIGANNALFFSGPVSSVFSFTGNPFLFDPSKGNLLLDVFVNTPSPVNSALAGGCSTDTNRVFNFVFANGLGPAAIGNSSQCNPNSFGLETQFTFAVAKVPEPSELSLFGVGLLGLLGIGAMRRRKNSGDMQVRGHNI